VSDGRRRDLKVAGPNRSAVANLEKLRLKFQRHPRHLLIRRKKDFAHAITIENLLMIGGVSCRVALY